jgi:xylulokinase
LIAIIIDQDLKVIHENFVDFDLDLPSYHTTNGVHVGQDGKEITAPVILWLEALDKILQQFKTRGIDLASISAISGAGMQHGTVFWSHEAEKVLRNFDSDLNSQRSLVEQSQAVQSTDGCHGALSHPNSPNWQDASTQSQCSRYEEAVGGLENLAKLTGSRAHHRFSGPQIMKFREKYPDKYEETGRISLVSSFLASVLLGGFAPIDRADAGGMNLQNMQTGEWDQTLLELTAGGRGDVDDLCKKLGDVSKDPVSSLGTIQPYFVRRYGFSKDCKIFPFTGDNPATMLSLPLQENEAIISLGTSTTFLMSTSLYNPDPSYHFMHHPTTPGLYMFMLCYKNGSLAREQVRDDINAPVEDLLHKDDPWSAFNTLLSTTPVLGQLTPNSPAKLGLFFPRPEIIPPASAGIHRALYTPKSSLTVLPSEPDNELWDVPNSDARALLESQLLSIRIRAAPMLNPRGLKRIYLAGGGAKNDAIARVCGDVLGGEEGVWRLENVEGGACAVGAANRAAWGYKRESSTNIDGESFEDFLARKWDASNADRITKVADGYKAGVWERYGDVVEGMEQLEKIAMGDATRDH